jgi:predicted nucleic acid-binding protein
MAQHEPGKPRVFVDADVLFAGSASPTEHGASLVVLRMAEITLIEALTSQQVITEAERNLQAKLPRALPAFQMLVQRCLQIVSAPKQTELAKYDGLADEKDLPILVAAVREQCAWLVTFNTGDYRPGHQDVTVCRPGAFLQEARHVLGRMG